jgi:hypothetical protein
MNKKQFPFIAIICSLAIGSTTSCKKSNDSENPKVTTVYAAGRVYNGTRFVAKLWKNGMATNLTNGATDADAFSVFVSGNDVYVAGEESNGTKIVAKLWKNGVATNLTNGTNNA